MRADLLRRAAGKSVPLSVDYLVVGGGGSGGSGSAYNAAGGGGGAGGVLTGTLSTLSLGVSYPITVGLGGVGPAPLSLGNNGQNSIFHSLTAIGGGAGASRTSAGQSPANIAGNNGGSGGGGSGSTSLGGTPGAGGQGTAGQGNNGGAGANNQPLSGGGGGGAGGVGGTATTGNGGKAGNGGVGIVSDITGTATYYGGGGGGGIYCYFGSPYIGAVAGTGGTGGGGNGSGSVSAAGGNGVPNTGGGGGGGSTDDPDRTPATGSGTAGGSGGSGVVILKFTTCATFTTTGTLTYTEEVRESSRIVKFTSGTGNIIFSAVQGDCPQADPNFSSVSLLLHMDGTNGSTSFVDSGPNALAVTASGNAQISNTQSKFGGASGAFDGTSDYLTATLSALGTGDFTIEFWIYFNSISTTYLIYDTRPSGSNGWYPTIYFDASAGLINYYSSSAVRITGTVATPAGAWHHVALCRSSGSTRLFINGTQSGSTFTDSNSYLSTTGRPTIGADGNSLGANCLNGYIDDLRVTTVARYTSNFTPRAKAFPDIYNPYKTLPVSGAALWLDGADSSSLFTDAGVTPVKVNGDLVYQWNDKSGNSRHATQITSGNRPTWVPPASGRNGLGALAFNNSQWIDLDNTTSYNLGSSNFTIEGWFKLSTTTQPSTFIAKDLNGNRSWLLAYETNSTITFVMFSGINGSGAKTLANPYTLGANTWFHIAVVRSGNTVSMYINGVLQANTVDVTGFSAAANTSAIRLGMHYSSFNGYNMKGQIQNAIIWLQALYTSNFTPWMS